MCLRTQPKHTMLYVVIAASMALASARSPTTTISGNDYSESSEPTICYGDDECRGRMVCDMGSYICVEPTPSPETPAPTDAPGCCYNPDSYKGNDRCSGATTQSRCEDMGCAFMVTDDYSDCVFTTTESPTTTEEVGCCMGDSVKTNAMCNNRLTRQQCDRSSSCNFVKDGVLDEGDCDFGTTQPPEEPGCCYGNPDIAYSKRWMEQCKDYGTERECLMLEDADGNKRCTFEPMNDYMDCEAVWPTTTETPTEAPAGCRGTSYKSNDKCRRNDNDEAKCVKQGCAFVRVRDHDDVGGGLLQCGRQEVRGYV